MGKSKLPDGWTLTVEIEGEGGVAGQYSAVRQIEQGTYDLHSDSLDGLVAAAKEYDERYARHQDLQLATGPATSEGSTGSTASKPTAKK